MATLATLISLQKLAVVTYPESIVPPAPLNLPKNFRSAILVPSTSFIEPITLVSLLSTVRRCSQSIPIRMPRWAPRLRNSLAD